jgi:hypothetical protein
MKLRYVPLNPKMMYRIYSIMCMVSIIWVHCTTTVPETRPEKHLNATEQNEFLYKIARYHGKLPPKSNHVTKFNPEFDADYRQIASKYELIAYYPKPQSDTIFFMTYRMAPSMIVKKVATAGKLVWGEDDKPLYYEEIFRTWKMVPDELDIKAGMLWSKLLSNEDLGPYLPQNSGEDEYIEFPDQNTKFDVSLKRWISSRENPLEEFYLQETDQKKF